MLRDMKSGRFNLFLSERINSTLKYLSNSLSLGDSKTIDAILNCDWFCTLTSCHTSSLVHSPTVCIGLHLHKHCSDKHMTGINDDLEGRCEGDIKTDCMETDFCVTE